AEEDAFGSRLTIKKFREYAKIIHINFYMPIGMYADKIDAVKYGAELVFHGADSMLPMGVTNDTLKYMTDNYVPVFGHIGAISGWQTNATGYKKCGKTAEEAFKIFKWGYEYQENGMGAMTIELTPMEVSQAIAEKLRVPVISIAGGAPCDGSEMVDMDTFGVMPKAASHAKTYAQLLPFLCEAYSDWADDVRDGDYPEDKHGYHMDPEELEKFNEMMVKFEG
ncbi:MAG: 3-methyl-2-oxobutanoate hydroxymethyltransferase, partial [Eggerthellaceae bacterium]|nr:3-methyl-2-oxobutanoate hydroxymethyltransferase [Eggerthellaceae bacterium]